MERDTEFFRIKAYPTFRRLCITLAFFDLVKIVFDAIYIFFNDDNKRFLLLLPNKTILSKFFFSLLFQCVRTKLPLFFSLKEFPMCPVSGENVAYLHVCNSFCKFVHSNCPSAVRELVKCPTESLACIRVDVSIFMH